MAYPLVRRLTIELSRLPASFAGMTVAVVADLHGRRNRTGVAVRLVRQTNELRADLIVLLGDMIHYAMDGREILPSLAGLSAKRGVWACLGNHEHGFVWLSRHVGARRHPSVNEWRRAYSDANIHLLVNEAAALSKGGERLWLAGIDDTYSGRADLSAALDGVGERECVLAITHSPDILDADGVQAVDLVLAGHTHGGQICLPGIGPVWAPCRYARRRAAGLVTGERTNLLVTRGVGEGIPIRIGCPREIWLVTLAKAEGEEAA